MTELIVAAMQNHPANRKFFEDAISDIVPGILGTGMAAGSGLNLNSKVPVGKEEKSVNVMTILKDKTL